MEGISSEASSIAGHLKLSNLIYVYDDNKISIDGSTDLTFSEDVAKRYESYGWYVQKVDGHNHEQIRGAMKNAVAEKERPSLIVARTQIAYGSPNKQGKASSHGAPLGADEIAKTKANIQWTGGEAFHVPASVTEHFRTKWLRFQRNKKNGRKLSLRGAKQIQNFPKSGTKCGPRKFPPICTINS
ncbi:MAG: hypothetical protein R2877_00585 [Bdellovibrionota bacterium]